MLLKSAVLIAGAGFAVAQNISSQCSSTLLSIATSSQASCLDLTLLAPLAISGSTNTSVVPTVNSWLTGMCSQGPCSNATLQAIVTNFTSGCASDLASLGFATNDTSGLVTTVQVAYPAVRQIACLKDTSANTLCVTETLNDIQSEVGTLSINEIVSLITEGLPGGDTGIPQNVTCSNCAKAAYTIASNDFPTLVSGEQSSVQSTCGSSFTNGQIPSGIQETASNSTSTSSSSGASHFVGNVNVVAAMLIAVSSWFALFA